jgi:hypothetical protein
VVVVVAVAVAVILSEMRITVVTKIDIDKNSSTVRLFVCFHYSMHVRLLHDSKY